LEPDYFVKSILRSLLKDSLWRVKSIKDCYLVRSRDISINDISDWKDIEDNDMMVSRLGYFKLG
jgi:hypothetical protein